VVDKLERVSPKTAPRQITTDEVDALELESQAAKIGADDLDAEPKIRVGEDWTAGLVIRSKKKATPRSKFFRKYQRI